MHLFHISSLAIAFVMLVPAALNAQDASRVVAGGGVAVPGWTGKIDVNEERAGRTLSDAKLTKTGDTFHVTTGPAVTYWNPAGKATGDYTVKATFTEPKYMNLNSHPHPYGLFIAGNDLGTANQSYLYCAAYGNGNFIVRGFGPGPFQMNGFAGEANPAQDQRRRRSAAKCDLCGELWHDGRTHAQLHVRIRIARPCAQHDRLRRLLRPGHARRPVARHEAG